MSFRALALVATAVLLAPGHLTAQTSAVVDEATFMVSRKGAPVGRESYRIIRAAGSGGQVFRAVSTSALGEVRLSSTLATDSSGAPVSYELRITQRGEQIQFLQGRGRPDRFSVLVQTKSGEAAREYLIRRATVLLDDELFHPLYFAALAGLAAPDSTVTVISPREASQRQHRLEFRGIEVVVVGGQNLTGRRFAFVDSATVRAELWIDAAGRVLKAAYPEKALVALRDDPPR
ncbi:MAG: hypothetical protein AABZ80_12315 [Gemmatimonadota bacterium]